MWTVEGWGVWPLWLIRLPSVRHVSHRDLHRMIVKENLVDKLSFPTSFFDKFMATAITYHDLSGRRPSHRPGPLVHVGFRP